MKIVDEIRLCVRGSVLSVKRVTTYNVHLDQRSGIRLGRDCVFGLMFDVDKIHEA